MEVSIMAIYNTRQQPAANTTYGQDDIFVSCSGDWGGAIYVSWKTKLTLNGSTFSSNTANQGGGALGIARTNLVSNDVLYVDNKSKGRGGAININYSSQITGGTFARNSAVTTGGAIYQSKDGYSTLTIKSVEFSGNISGGDGGAIYQVDAGSNTDITGSSFVGNTSGGNGGALYIIANASLNGVVFDGNKATADGGAIYLLDTATISVENTSFLKKSDTIYNAGTINFSGAISLAGDVTSTGTINVADETGFELLLADRSVSDNAILDYDALTLAGSCSFSVTVAEFQTSGSYKLVANGENITSITVSSLADTSKSIVVTERDTEYVLGNQKFTLTDDAAGNLCLTVHSPEQVFYAKTFDSNGNVIASYASPEIAVPFDTTNAKRVEIYEGAILSGSTERAYLGSNSIDCTVTGATFSNNIFTGLGGAVAGSNLQFSATDTLFIGNKANGGGNNGGAIWYNVNDNNPGRVDLTGGSFVSNTAQGSGGAIFVNCGGYSLQVAKGTWTGVEFNSNSAAYGGAVFLGDGQAPNYPLADIVIDNAKFFNNRATGTGGAIKNNSQLTVSNSVFRGNSAGTNGGAINNYGTITIANCSFETVTDTIFNDKKTMNWGGKISLAGDVTSTGTLNVADGTEINLLLAPRTTANGTILDYDALTLAGSCTFSVTVDTLQESGIYKLVANGANITTVTVSSLVDTTASITITERDTEYVLGNQKFTLVDDADGNLCLNVKSPIYARTFDSNGNILNSYLSPEISALPLDTTDAKRVEIYEGAILDGSDSRAYSGGNTISCVATGATFSNNISSGAGAAVGGSNLQFTANNVLFTGNSSTSNNGGAIWYNVNSTSVGKVTVSESTFRNNYAGVYGGAIYTIGTYAATQSDLTITDSEFSGNSSVYGGGAVFGENSYAGITVKNSDFSGNSSSRGGAIESWGILSVTGGEFSNNSATGNGGAIYNKNIATLDGVNFNGNSAVNGGAIYNVGTCTVTDATFATATDTIYNSGMIEFSGTITLNASLAGNGSWTIAEGTVFALGYGIDLNNVDFSNATLTVDGLGLEAGAVIATGVTGTIGADDTVVNGKEGLSLAIMNGDLILKQDAELAGTQFVGSNCNYITGGEISGTLYSTTTYSSAVHTTLSNGTVGQYLLGGLWKKGAVENAVEKAAVTIAGGLVKGSVYAGGYSAGANGSTVVPAEALMNVTVSSLDLSGGKVNGDIYGGIHACKYGYGKVGTVNLSVSGGIHNNVMGGGWAEQIAVSTVDSVDITVSGGEVDMLFAGGGASLKNSANISTVGTANITISGGTVKNIFLSGLNENCDIIGDVTLNISSDNSFDLITGLDYNGLDSTTGTGTVAIRTTAVACGEMNNIDTLVIGENCTLTLDSVENIGKVVFDDVVGEFNWTALDISGLSDVFANVDFEFNGSSYDTLADFIASGNASVEENKRLILTGTLA